MKTVLLLITLMLAFVPALAQPVSGVTDLDQRLANCDYIAVDSAISGTKYSKVLTLNSKDVNNADLFVNYATGHILVLARQTNDSILAEVYLEYGKKITGGTYGKDFGRVFIDTLQSTKHSINIDLTPYLDYAQVRIRVVLDTTGSKSGLLPKWSAVFAGKGKLGQVLKTDKKTPFLQ
jgi:hypothetical protein